MKVTAKEAVPGFYATPHGRVLKVVPRGKVSGRWSQQRKDWIPYKSLGNPAARSAGRTVTIYGWLPPDYELRPVGKPRWWKRQEARPPKRRGAGVVEDAAAEGESA